MISGKSAFWWTRRGFKETLVLIPGWATDHRIFSAFELSYDYLVPTGFSPAGFVDDLVLLLDRLVLPRVSLWGWSLGGFLASEFAARFPARVKALTVSNIRRRYESSLLDGIRNKILKDKKAYLYKFYLSCFSRADAEGLEWFRKNLLKDYLERMETAHLLEGLDYLASVRFDPPLLQGIKEIRCFHGEDDAIAPYPEAQEAVALLKQARFTLLPGVGHLPFFSSAFKTSAP